MLSASLELRHFREIEIPDLHGGNNHVERLFSAGALRHAHGFHVGEHVNETFVKAKVANAAAQLAIFYQERSVARHSGELLLEGLDFADVPQARHQHAALGGCDHLVDRLRIAAGSED